jgi:Fic family protein
MSQITIASLPLKIDVETKAVLRKVASAHRLLAELKGILTSIPNETILLETLTLREARESAAIENIISTIDEVYQSNYHTQQFLNPAAKEVHQYAHALKKGHELVKKNDLLTIQHIIKIQETVEENNAGFRKLPGTKLLNDKTGEVIYTPPQDNETIVSLMKNLERFINDDELSNLDPLVKMAIIHHQFESIHPFYDGNGRTGRIINILYLVKKKLLTLPILYLSNYIIKNKSDYYRLLQSVRNDNNWEPWILFILNGVEESSASSISIITSIRELMQVYKLSIKKQLPKIYSQDLLNNIFKYPYTKIEYLQKGLDISRSTSIRYLNALIRLGILKKKKIGRDNFFLNEALFKILAKK